MNNFLTGTFESIFKEGEDCTKSFTKLTQSDKHIKGLDIADNRTWELEGRIIGDQVVGIYFNESSQSTGTFILQIKDNDTLEGMWSTYDKDSGEYYSDVYQLKRM